MARTKKLTDYLYSPTNPSSEDAIRTQIDDSIQEVYDQSARANATVNITGNQTISDIKTFTSSPIVPTPTTDLQASTKKYVDDRELAIETDFNAKDAQNVKLTGNQIISDVKTFSSSPIVPTPTTNFQASTKKYVDDTAAGVVLGQIPDGSLTDTKLSDTAGQIKDRVATNTTNISTNTTNFSNFSSDFEYPEATVVSREIQITKLGTNAVSRFKLSSAIVAGTVISISLDAGVSSLPLKDIENNDVLELEAGFYEVIADATFFTLRPSGGIKINEQDIVIGVAQGTIEKFDACYVDRVIDNIDKLSNPSILPTGIGNGTAFSQDGIYLSVVHDTSPFITIYKRSGDAFTKLANQSTLPTGSGYGTAFSPDGTYLSVAHDVSPFITIYKRSGDTFTKLADPSTLPTGAGRGTAFSTDGTYLSVAHDTSPYITIYKRSGDVFTKLANPSTLPTGIGRGISFSPDDIYLSVAHSVSPFITIYKRSGDTFTKLSNPSILPTGAGYGTAFSSDGTYLSVAHLNSPYITIYKHIGDTFTKLADPSTLPTGAGQGTAFSPDSIYLSVAHNTSPFITIYKRSGDTFTKLSNPSTLPTNSGLGTAFGPDGIYLSVAQFASPYITIYKNAYIYPTYKSTSIDDLIDRYGAGYSKQNANLGSNVEVVRIFR